MHLDLSSKPDLALFDAERIEDASRTLSLCANPIEIPSRVLAGSRRMYAVIILEEAHEDLRNIVAYISKENPGAAETLGRELLDEAMSLESLPYRGSRVKKRRGLLKLIHESYLIYYRIQEQKKVVEIVAFNLKESQCGKLHRSLKSTQLRSID
jgi:toxin ParE1/3/4